MREEKVPQGPFGGILDPIINIFFSPSNAHPSSPPGSPSSRPTGSFQSLSSILSITPLLITVVVILSAVVFIRRRRSKKKEFEHALEEESEEE